MVEQNILVGKHTSCSVEEHDSTNRCETDGSLKSNSKTADRPHSVSKSGKHASEQALDAVLAPGSIDSVSRLKEDILMQDDFKPSNWHVLCGREKQHTGHIGNRRLRVLVALNLPVYMEAESRKEKTKLINKIVSQVRESGGFLSRTREGRWKDVGLAQAREKVGHLFRDSMVPLKGSMYKKRSQRCCEAQTVIFENLQLTLSPKRRKVSCNFKRPGIVPFAMEDNNEEYEGFRFDTDNVLGSISDDPNSLDTFWQSFANCI